MAKPVIDIVNVDHYGVRVRDLDRAMQFYSVLGFSLHARAGNDAVAIVRDPHGVEINLVFNANADAGGKNILMDVGEKYPGYTHVALRVSSIKATLLALRENGVRITHGAVSLRPDRHVSVFVRDPDLEPVELRGRDQMLSSVCQPGLEATAAAANTVRVFQLYVRGGDAWVDDFVHRARDNGFCAFCLTVDVAAYSRRERDLLGRFVKPWRARAIEGAAFQAGLSWDHVKRFKGKYPDVPLIIKGIATAEDAELCVQHGVEVIYVSNHGVRQLDHLLGSPDVLPQVLQAVAQQTQV